MAAVGRLHPPSGDDETAQAMAAHQPLNPATASLSSVCPQGGMHARTTVTASTIGVHLADLGQQGMVVDGALAVRPGSPSIVAGG